MNNIDCYSCDFCNCCNSCDSCDSCDSCNYCKNLKMSEYNLFCYSKQYNDENSFQQKRYRAFNKEIGKDRYIVILKKVKRILNQPKKNLQDFWKQITQSQWEQLLAIPEAKDFKEGFEYISGQKIETSDKVKIICEGKEVRISRESAKALGLVN